MAVSTSAFLLVSMSGVGVAADRAVPGDLLYPLDRMLEAVGLSSDLVEERLLEAITLTERGDMTLAIETANEALVELSRTGVPATWPTTEPDSDVIAAETVIVETTSTTGDTPEQSDTAAATVSDSSGASETAVAPADAVQTLRLAAEQLLASVRSAKTESGSSEEVTSAAIFLAEATANVTSIQMSVATSTTSSSTTSSTSTTTTTVAEPRPGNRNGNTGESGTTTTTVTSESDDGSGSDDSSGGGQDGSQGPIFLPSP